MSPQACFISSVPGGTVWQTLHEAGIPSGPMRTIPEVAKDPHMCAVATPREVSA